MLLPPTDETVLSYCLKTEDKESLKSKIEELSFRLNKLEHIESKSEREFLLSLLGGDPQTESITGMSIEEVDRLSTVPEEHNKLIKEANKLRFRMYLYLLLIFIYYAYFLTVVLRISEFRLLTVIILVALTAVTGYLSLVSYRRSVRIRKQARKLLIVNIDGKKIVRKKLSQIQFSLVFKHLDFIDITGIDSREKVRCYICLGKGFNTVTCGTCQGYGYVEKYDNNSERNSRIVCPQCGGKGKILTKCVACSGLGKFDKLATAESYNSIAEKLNREIYELASKVELLEKAKLWINNFNAKIAIWNSKLNLL